MTPVTHIYIFLFLDNHNINKNKVVIHLHRQKTLFHFVFGRFEKLRFEMYI